MKMSTGIFTRKGRQLLWALLASLPVACVPGTLALAAVPAASEYEVKAAFLFQFSRFVEWPPESFASATAPLTICVLGDNPFGSTLHEISQGESVETHALVIELHEHLENLDRCHIVFVSQASTAVAPKVIAYLAGKRVLTVGDGSNFTQLGGVIGFVTVNGKVRLQVNRNSAESAQLRISAKLLRVAEQIS
jgi:hypothetical protein